MIKFTSNRGLGRGGSRGYFRPDRRSMFFLSLFNGSYANAPNPYGLENNWRDINPNPMNWLLNRISGAYVSGYQKILLYLPAGSPSGQGSSYFAADQWFNMPAAKQSGFITGIRPFVNANPDLELGIYMGFLAQASTGIYTIDSIFNQSNAFSIRNNQHLNFYTQITSGWKAAGIKFLVSDFASPFPAQYNDLIRAFPDFKWIGEAIPREVPVQGQPYKYVNGGPSWLTTDTYQKGSVDPGDTWAFDGGTTEIYVVLQSYARSGEVITDFIDRGFIPVDYNGFSSGFINNHYIPSIEQGHSRPAQEVVAGDFSIVPTFNINEPAFFLAGINDNDPDNDMWAIESTYPYIDSAQIDIPNAAAGNPSGFAIPTGISADSAAIASANWIQYYHDRLLNKFNSKGKTWKYAFAPTNYCSGGNIISDPPNGYNAILNYRDRVDTLPTGVGLYSIFTTTGRLLQKSWGSSYVSGIFRELVSRSLTGPSILLANTSNNFDLSVATQTNGSGWFTASMANPIMNLAAHNIDGLITLSGAWNGRFNISGLTFAHNTTGSLFGDNSNRALASWLGGIEDKVIDYTLHDTLYQYIKNTWPEATVANKDIFTSITGAFVPRGKAYLNSCNTTGIRADYSQPVCGFPTNTDFDATDPLTSGSINFARYGITPVGVAQTDLGSWFKSHSKAKLSGVRFSSTKDIIPWIVCSGESVSLSVGNYPSGGSYTAGTADIIEIMRYGADIGIHKWVFNIPTGTPEMYTWIRDTSYTIQQYIYTSG